ncbi:hypothetical protein [Parasitella parasitica]|uniref:Uncharacterized protein n=1 Tax=Parasitella parasitica TaxID=35722 RepID=A0A0B7N6H0_9FUNG|nr:hypothetical protein [Parasitella parasitica]
MYPDLLDMSTNDVLEQQKPYIDVIMCWCLFGLVHLALWLLLIAEFYFFQLPVLINRRYGPRVCTLLWATLPEFKFLKHALVVIFSAIGLVYPGFHSVHLLDFVFRDSILQGVISSITLNVDSIPRTLDSFVVFLQLNFNATQRRGLKTLFKMITIFGNICFSWYISKTKNTTEYMGPESYVAGCLKNADYRFFPINKASDLSTHEQDDSERLERLEEMNQLLLEKLTRLEEHIEKLTDQQSRSRPNSFMLSPM